MVTIQPITNQYTTAFKERQHIIDKLNEIITGLNALQFDDLTAISIRLDEVSASITALQTELNDNVEQIESELTSYDNRITQNAGKITDNTNEIVDTNSHLNTFENSITSELSQFKSQTQTNLNTKINRSGDSMTGALEVPDSATGVRSKIAVNGNRLQADLDNYAPMIRNSGNSRFTGEKISITANGLGMETTANYNAFRIKSNSFYNTIIANKLNPEGEDRGWRIESSYNTDSLNNLAISCYSPRINFGDESEKQQNVSLVLYTNRETGECRLSIVATLPDGTQHTKILAKFTGGNWE